MWHPSFSDNLKKSYFFEWNPFFHCTQEAKLNVLNKRSSEGITDNRYRFIFTIIFSTNQLFIWFIKSSENSGKCPPQDSRPKGDFFFSFFQTRSWKKKCDLFFLSPRTWERLAFLLEKGWLINDHPASWHFVPQEVMVCKAQASPHSAPNSQNVKKWNTLTPIFLLNSKVHPYTSGFPLLPN